MYDKLLQLPLFQGLSGNDWAYVAGHTIFEFRRYHAGETLIHEGDRCRHLLFLIKGKLQATATADDRSYQIVETYTAPFILQPENLFGLTQRYTQTFKAQTNCEFLLLSKDEVVKLSDNFEVFRINLLNMITTLAQRLASRTWHVPPITLREKIARFVTDRCRIPAGHKFLQIKMERLAELVGASRLNVSRELHKMEQEGLVNLRRSEIEIFALQDLHS